MSLALATAALAAQVGAAPPSISHFVCEMRPGDFLEGGAASAEDLRHLPARWRVEIDEPAARGDRVRYVDELLGAPIRIRAIMGHQNSFFWGDGGLVLAERDEWSVRYTLARTEAGEASIWVRYLRSRWHEGVSQVLELNAIGSCHELVSYPYRNSQ